ncbi:MAG: MBL fold metallo-hydrolase [Cohnella sp.]|nr:MBL fold metallo-hydrolase [Cohnella sp.]
MQTLEQLSTRIWYHTPVSETDRPILCVVAGDNKSLMIDAGNSEAHARSFLGELAARNIRQPSIVALTHWHWDHIFGLSALNMTSIASVYTKAEMAKLLPFEWTDEALDRRVREGVEIEFCANAIKREYGASRNIAVKLPDITFERRLEIDLGGVTCILQHVGGDHAADSIVVYIKEEKILFLGDCIYADIYNGPRKLTAERTLRLLDVLAEFDAETYILSHWKPVSREEYDQEAALLANIAKLTVRFNGSFERIKQGYEEKLGRSVNEEELEVMTYFVNGYER